MDVWFIVFIAAAAMIVGGLIALIIRALVEVWHDSSVTSPSRELWMVGIVLFPIVGTLAWYFLSPRGVVNLPSALTVPAWVSGDRAPGHN